MSDNNYGDETSVKFLLQELTQIEAERHRLRGKGDQRLNVFLSLTSALLGGVGIFGQTASVSGFEYILLIALVFLCIVGWQTLRYIVGRDIATDRALRSAGRIRRYFSDRDPIISKYLLGKNDDEPTSQITRNGSNVRQTVEAILSLLLAFLIGDLVYIFALPMTIILIIVSIVFLVSLFILNTYAKSRFRKELYIATKEINYPKQNLSTTSTKTMMIGIEQGSISDLQGSASKSNYQDVPRT